MKKDCIAGRVGSVMGRFTVSVGQVGIAEIRAREIGIVHFRSGKLKSTEVDLQRNLIIRLYLDCIICRMQIRGRQHLAKHRTSHVGRSHRHIGGHLRAFATFKFDRVLRIGSGTTKILKSRANSDQNLHFVGFLLT
jgi:hypothetical protein